MRSFRPPRSRTSATPTEKSASSGVTAATKSCSVERASTTRRFRIPSTRPTRSDSSTRCARERGSLPVRDRSPMKILAVDVGGTNVKVLASGHRTPIKIKSGPTLTPREMVRAVREAAADWKYDRVSIGYPGPLRAGKPVEDPWNLGPGWVGFDFRRAFGKPVRLVNDAAMQALGSYEGGGTMLFLGLGT